MINLTKNTTCPRYLTYYPRVSEVKVHSFLVL